MARQPDIQYIQMYNYGSTAPKLAPRPQQRKQKYQLPEQRARQIPVRQTVLDPLSVCAIAVACVMLLTMLIGVVKISQLSARQQELDQYVDALQTKRADLQRTFDNAYDLHQVELRAREMGLVAADEAVQIQMGPVNPEPSEEPGFFDRLEMIFDELFAKAPH